MSANKSANASSYRIVGMPDRDFPKVPDHREATYATVESAVLREMMSAPCSRSATTRPGFT